MTERSYPPDYVSAETLAYRLDCEISMIETLMRRGALPRPRMIGELARWDFNLVPGFIEALCTKPAPRTCHDTAGDR
jgi:hypothetical protein